MEPISMIGLWKVKPTV